MTRPISLAIFLLLGISGTFGQSRTLAQGNPALTQSMADKLEFVYSRLLDIKLNVEQRGRFQNGLIKYWTEKNQDGIKTSLDNLKYYDSPEQLNELRTSSQGAIVEGLRRDAAETGDPVSGVLVEAFDIKHPGQSGETRVRTFADLVGIWKRQDALGAGVDPNSGRTVGVSYTDSGTLEITSNRAFTMVKVHNHCSGTCCRMDGSEEKGTVSLVTGKMVFQTLSGSKLTEDACLAAKQRSPVKAHSQTVTWSIRPNPDTNATTLCLNTGPDKAECYEKQ
ncbi:MAG: hypothetical protein ACJ72Z_01490 [Pyrinomonadaceae bacterium]